MVDFQVHYDVDAIAKVGAALLDISVSDDSPIEQISQEKPPETVETGERFFKDKALATPAVRRIARENNVTKPF